MKEGFLTGVTLFFYVILITTFLSFSVLGATGDITAVRILEDGWIAEIDIEGFSANGTYNFGLGGNNSLEDPAVIFNVVSEGYNSSGILGTINRTVYGTHWIRQAYPNDALKNETESGGDVTLRIALSDFIYNDDKAGGAGTSGTNATVSITAGFYYDNSSGGTDTNNSATADLSVNSQSTLDYPKVIGRWAWPGYERVTEDFLVEAVAFHRFARYGKPIALIDFLAIDQSGNSTSSNATAITVSNRTGDANVVLVYATTIDVDALDTNETINITFAAYPWVGDADSILNSSVGSDGVEQPNEGLGPLHEFNDKSETYGVGYAYVSESGNDGTGQVYSDQGSAEAGNAYLTIEKAAQGIRTYHNANHGRDNAGGGTVLVAEGNYTFPGATVVSKGASMDTWLIIKSASDTNKDNVRINDSSGSLKAFKAPKLKIENMVINGTDAFVIYASDPDILWIHNNSIEVTITAIHYFDVSYATQNQVSSSFSFASYSTTDSPWALIRGNTANSIISATLYSVLGNKNIIPQFQAGGNVNSHAVSNNSIYAFNTNYEVSVISVDDPTFAASEVAIVQNVFESTSIGNALFSIFTGNQSKNNLLLWHNTFVGQREILGYNSVGNYSYDRLNWAQKFNIYDNWNNKDDTFLVENSNRTGSWPVGYNVGSIGNSMKDFIVQGEFDGLYTILYTNASYIDDNSASTGDSSGNGNYTLNANSSLINVIDQNISDLSFYWVLPFDLLGNPIYDSPDTGAYEYQPEFNIATNPLNISSEIRIYGDGSWKIKNPTGTVSNITANLTLSIPGSDTSKYVDINISAWDVTEDMTWVASSEVSVDNVVHSIGNLSADTNYIVQVDGVTGQNIVGLACTSGVCLSNSTGYIDFNYTGGFSSHTFNITEQPAAAVASVVDEVSSVSGGGVTIYYIEKSRLQEGYGKKLFNNFKLKFEIKNQSHELKVDEIKNTSIIITISSEPIIFELNLNETKKVDIDNDGYYDILLEIKNISGRLYKYVNIYIKSINEKILVIESEDNAKEIENNTTEDIKEVVKIFSVDYRFLLGMVILFIIILIIFIKKPIKKLKKRKHN